MKGWKKALKKIWYFIWEDNSIWSWIVNIALAFVLIKYVVYPVLSLLLLTSHPVVAVVSDSMEHNGNFDAWWSHTNNTWYKANSINKGDFYSFSFRNGFRRGDIMVLKGKKPQDIKIGDVMVFWSAKKDPIIHRVVKKWQENYIYYFQTKGDNYKTNPTPIKTSYLDETRVSEKQIVGNAVFRIPLLGYIKIWFVELILRPLATLSEAVAQKG